MGMCECQYTGALRTVTAVLAIYMAKTGLLPALTLPSEAYIFCSRAAHFPILSSYPLLIHWVKPSYKINPFYQKTAFHCLGLKYAYGTNSHHLLDLRLCSKSQG